MPDQYVLPTLSMRRTASVSDMLNRCVNHATASSTSNGISPLEALRWRWFSAQNASPAVSAQAIGTAARLMKLLSAAVLTHVFIHVTVKSSAVVQGDVLAHVGVVTATHDIVRHR